MVKVTVIHRIICSIFVSTEVVVGLVDDFPEIYDASFNPNPIPEMKNNKHLYCCVKEELIP